MANDKGLGVSPYDRKPDLAGLETATLPWRSFSGHGGNSCVEVAAVGLGVVVRDSKDPAGPVLAFSSNEWAALVGAVKDGKLDDTVVA